MSLADKFITTIKKQDLFSSKDKLLLAVSGGVDSVVLCELCKQAGYNFSMAHCNFQLRGAESDRDELFVRELAKKHKIKIEVKKFDTEKYATENKISVQEAARKLRYDWFAELIGGQKETCLLTAHHADDNIETLLMNFFRGTGLHGLTGIPAKTSYIRRPLLDFRKEELISFARENKLDFVEDSSNLSSKYTRNFFRNELLPAISKVFPEVNQNLADNIDRFKEIENLYRVSVEKIKKKLCRESGKEVKIPVKQLMEYKNRALLYEIISGYGFNEKQVDEVIKLASSESGRYILSPSGNYRIIKHRHWFIISPVNTGQSENIIIEEADREIVFAAGKLFVEKTNSLNPDTNNKVACMDSGKISYPLLLRKWKTGDYFYPLGMKKKKKLARFFIDLKLPVTEKEKIWVLESDQKIIWVIGYRIDERCRITDATKEV
ncbi:MAG TPA: tRNA lysidine(34) synthetase TilS, partial [Chitinophagaceae bacterium]|nr:tRNA lysidine(34) synthetase TilS [Chitinophagaceae bacterium]